MNLERIELKQVAIGYEQLLAEKVEITLPQKEIVRVHGATGSGKSTLLKVMAGLLNPLSGQYLINDLDVNQMSFEELIPIRLKIGYSFDMGGLLNNRTLRENLMLPLLYHKVATIDEIEARVRSTLEAFELTKVADKRPASVSGSQRKAACVARAFVFEPQFLILDDPTTGLGDSQRECLARWINERKKSGQLRFCILTSQNQRFLQELAPIELNLHPELKAEAA